MSDERKESLFIIAYKGRDTADQVYDVLRGLEKQKQIDIKTAATIERKGNRKLKLKHKRRVTVWPGLIGGTLIGLVLIGSGGALAGAIIGGLLGSSYAGKRTDTKKFLDDKLGPDDSALAILVKEADWADVDQAIASYNGEELKVELTQEAQEQIAALAANDDVAEALQEEVEVEEDAS